MPPENIKTPLIEIPSVIFTQMTSIGMVDDLIELSAADFHSRWCHVVRLSPVPSRGLRANSGVKQEIRIRNDREPRGILKPRIYVPPCNLNGSSAAIAISVARLIVA